MRYIFVNRYFHPDHSATSQLLSDLAFHLARQGKAVTVITSTQRYDDPVANLPRHERIRGVNVVRIAGTRLGRGGLAGRAIDYLIFFYGVHKALLGRVDEESVVVAKSDPPMLSVVCGWAVRKKGGRLVAWLRDLFPEAAAAAGLGLPRVVVGALRWLRDRSLRQAEASVVLSPSMADRLRRAGLDEARIRIIGNWGLATLDAPTEPTDDRFRTVWGLQERFVVGYSGNLGRVHDVDTLLGGIEASESRAMDAMTWLFVGGGAGMARLRESIPMRALDRVAFHDYLPQKDLAYGLAVPDVHLVSLLPSMEGLVYPSKLAGILAAGKPVVFVGAEEGEIGKLLMYEGCGFTIESGDGDGLAQVLAELRADPGMRAAMGRRARALYERDFARLPALAAWSRLLATLERTADCRTETVIETT